MNPTLARVARSGPSIVPRFLGPADHPWLRRLVDVHVAFEGRARRALDERLREGVEGAPDAAAVALVARVLAQASASRSNESRSSESPPRQGPRGAWARRARSAAFEAMTRLGDRTAALADAAAALGVAPDEVVLALFADLPGERPVPALPEGLGLDVLALRANLALAQGLLGRAQRVTLRLRGNARAVVRLAKLRGLIAVALPGRGADGAAEVELDVSGPLSLFRHTTVYGRALGELLPALAWCERFELEAPLVLPDGGGVLRLATGDPVVPGREPRRFDSQLEARLARDLARLLPGWDVVREPEPVPALGSLIFPDLALVPREAPARRVLVEVLGFWTPGYLERKLAQVRDAGLERELVLCVDEAKACAVEAALPPGARIVPFRRRVRAEDVLACVGIRVEAGSPDPGAPRGSRRARGGSRGPRSDRTPGQSARASVVTREIR